MPRFKKLILSVIMLFVFSISAFAANDRMPIVLDGGFFNASTDKGRVAQITGMSEEELDRYCDENEITFLAVNRDNSKQVRITVSSTDFSKSVGNLSALSDEKIAGIMPLVTSSSFGETVKKDGQKFVKTVSVSNDSGGKYTVIRYYTVAADNLYVLSFFTEYGVDTDYAETAFKTFSQDGFNRLSDEKKAESDSRIIATAAAVFVLLTGYIVFTLIKDIKRGAGEETATESETEAPDTAETENSEKTPEDE